MNLIVEQKYKPSKEDKDFLWNIFNSLNEGDSMLTSVAIYNKKDGGFEAVGLNKAFIADNGILIPYVEVRRMGSICKEIDIQFKNKVKEMLN